MGGAFYMIITLSLILTKPQFFLFAYATYNTQIKHFGATDEFGKFMPRSYIKRQDIKIWL
jgi:hypothetical protein